jgi:UDPglucose 6-dehydrogenase
LRYPIVIDGRNLYDPQVMARHGFTYLSIGRPTAYPVKEAPQQEQHAIRA